MALAASRIRGNGIHPDHETKPWAEVRKQSALSSQLNGMCQGFVQVFLHIRLSLWTLDPEDLRHSRLEEFAS